MHIKAALLLIAVSAVPASAAVRWAGDFETGNLKQYTKAQAVSANRIQVVTDRVRQGRYAAKFTVHKGDDPINASGNRNELVDSRYQPEGTELYYGWSTLFAENFPSPKTWQLFAQWHQIEDYGSPPLQFVVNGEQMLFMVSPAQKVMWKAPLVRGVWQDFVLHVKFSNSASKGFVELWHNGKKVLAKTYAETRANNYLKLGLYRNESIGPVGVLYHDGMRSGERLEDVMPPAATRLGTTAVARNAAMALEAQAGVLDSSAVEFDAGAASNDATAQLDAAAVSNGADVRVDAAAVASDATPLDAVSNNAAMQFDNSALANDAAQLKGVDSSLSAESATVVAADAP